MSQNIGPYFGSDLILEVSTGPIVSVSPSSGIGRLNEHTGPLSESLSMLASKLMNEANKTCSSLQKMQKDQINYRNLKIAIPHPCIVYDGRICEWKIIVIYRLAFLALRPRAKPWLHVNVVTVSVLWRENLLTFLMKPCIVGQTNCSGDIWNQDLQRFQEPLKKKKSNSMHRKSFWKRVYMPWTFSGGPSWAKYWFCTSFTESSAS